MDTFVVQKNHCSLCGYNFAGITLFFDHKVGKFPSENNGVSTRRCLTHFEMLAKRWELHTLDMCVEVNGHKTLVPTRTWILPQTYVKRLVKKERGFPGRTIREKQVTTE